MLEHQAKERVQKMMQTIYKIRNNPDYIAVAVQYGKMDPKLHAIQISCAPNYDELMKRFEALHTEVETLKNQLSDALVLAERENWVGVDKIVLNEMHKAGIEVVLDVIYDKDGAELDPFGVFEAARNLKFAF